MAHILKNILSSVLSSFQKKKSFNMLSIGDYIYGIAYGEWISIPSVKRYKISSYVQGDDDEWRFRVEDGSIYIRQSEMDKTIVHRKATYTFFVSSIKDVKSLLRKYSTERFLPNYFGMNILRKYVSMKRALNGINQQ